MYLNSILWFASWPILIIAAYKIVIYAISKYEEQTTKN